MNPARAAWLGYWRLMRRWHRYEVSGLEHLTTGRAALIVGYHGRPIAHDLCMLTVEVHDRLGYLPHGIIHSAFDTRPRLKQAIDDLGFVTGDGPELGAAVARGEHIVVAPGGTREGCRDHRDRYRVAFGRRTGYLRLAARYGLPIVPVAASGVDDAYIGLNDGYALGKRLGAKGNLPIWFGIGPLGLWPLSPPFPTKIRQRIGAPIAPPSNEQKSTLEDTHAVVTGAVQRLLDLARTQEHS